MSSQWSPLDSNLYFFSADSFEYCAGFSIYAVFFAWGRQKHLWSFVRTRQGFDMRRLFFRTVDCSPKFFGRHFPHLYCQKRETNFGMVTGMRDKSRSGYFAEWLGCFSHNYDGCDHNLCWLETLAVRKLLSNWPLCSTRVLAIFTEVWHRN